MIVLLGEFLGVLILLLVVLEVLEKNFVDDKEVWEFVVKEMVLIYGCLLINDEKLMREICCEIFKNLYLNR